MYIHLKATRKNCTLTHARTATKKKTSKKQTTKRKKKKFLLIVINDKGIHDK